MGIERLSIRILSGITLFAGFGLTAGAQPPAVTVEEALRRQPKQPNVEISTPAPAQVGQCKVEPIPNKNDPKTPLGYVVRDPAGNPIRQFVSYDGKTFNIVAYYVNGVEAYREVYPPAAGEPHQYRWLGPNGTKWGLDRDRDGRIDEWVVLSPEELSQELFQAVLTRDAKRAEALAVSKANLDQLGLPQVEAQKLLARSAGAPKKALDAAEALKLTPDAKWGSVQLSAPQATPADAMGARDDLVLHKTGTVLIIDGKDGKDHKTLQTGELVQIGRAWKIVDGPAIPGGDSTGAPTIPENLRDLVQKLNDIDKEMPNPPTRESLAAYNGKRVAVLEQIVARVDLTQRDVWLKQLADSLSGAADAEKPDGPQITRLKSLTESLAKGPNRALAAYVAFRLLQAENNIALAHNTGPVEPVQEKWRSGLEEFIKAFPTSEEAPEAILRLAMALEYAKDGEAKAKEWYARLAKDYAQSPQSAKGAGAVKRLESVGKPLDLAGTNLVTGQPFSAASLKDKAVVVYYWASWSQSLPDDVKKLTSLVKEYGAKGLELVTVNLDHDARAAADAIAAHKIPGTHLFAPGGLDGSPLASSYGILVVPHLFVAGKDGKITSRTAQAATVEDDVKKLLP
jgi:thiol-disulfide isomerase/thioredoxin